LGTTGLADYAADLEDEIRALGEAPIPGGHSSGRFIGASNWRRARPSAP
jgi:hypothetical protein